MTTPVRLTFEEFAARYCERQEMTPEELKAVLQQQIRRYGSRGFMLLECQMMDSSRLGQYVILGYGGTHTYSEVPDHPISPRGLASDMSTVVAVVDALEIQS